jgi:hypothetical protein
LTFSWGTFGNGIVAILAGVLANFLASSFGYVAPFMAAIAFFGLSAVLVLLTWAENYGDRLKSSNRDLTQLIDSGVNPFLRL